MCLLRTASLARMSQDPSCGDLVIAIHMLDDRLPMPVFAHPGDAGADLATAVDIVIEPGERVLVPTGIAIALPSADYAALVFARSGLGIKKGVCLSNGVGVIDSDYRGEIKVRLIRDALSDSHPHYIDHGDRIAQGMLVKIDQWQFEEVLELSSTERGVNGHGSTGA